MKTNKDGKIKLEPGEYRSGNFVYKREGTHVKIIDINSQMSHRMACHLNVARLLNEALTLKSDNFLHEYASMLWLFSNVVPDRDFMREINDACVACINRDKELYGIKEDISKSEDDRILQDVKETMVELEKMEELEK